MIDRRLVQHFDWVLLSFTLLLVGIGLLALYSAVNAGPDVAHVTGPLYLKQAYWFGIGAAVMVVMFLFNYKWLNRWAFATYALSVALLVAVSVACAAEEPTPTPTATPTATVTPTPLPPGVPTPTPTPTLGHRPRGSSHGRVGDPLCEDRTSIPHTLDGWRGGGILGRLVFLVARLPERADFGVLES